MSPAASCCGTQPSFCRIVPAKPPTRNFKSFQIFSGVDFFAEPAAHLGTGIGRSKADAIEVLENSVEQLLAATKANPRNHLPGVESERQRGAESEGGILAEVVIQRGVAHLDGAVADGVEHLQPGDDFAGGKD